MPGTVPVDYMPAGGVPETEPDPKAEPGEEVPSEVSGDYLSVGYGHTLTLV